MQDGEEKALHECAQTAVTMAFTFYESIYDLEPNSRQVLKYKLQTRLAYLFVQLDLNPSYLL